MPRTYTIKDAPFESHLFLNRIVAAFAVIILLAAALAARLIYLQVVDHEHYTTLAQDNRIKISPLPPTRGLIYDRNGEILAENIPTYSLEVIPEQVPDLDKTLAGLKSLLNLTDDEIEQFHAQRARSKLFTSIPLRLRLNDEEVSKFSVVRPYFQGVDIHARLVRHYPQGEITSHVVGYMGRISEEELKLLELSSYRGTHHIGKIGIEKTYEDLLHGRAGYEEIESNAQGRAIHVVGAAPASPGADLYLTLDVHLQETAFEALGEYNGAVVAIEVGTGNTLVLVSKPGFNPNSFVYGISREEYQALQESGDQPLFNRALRGQYPPASTIKPFVGLAGLEYAVTSSRRRLFCPGFFQLPDSSHKYRDWQKYGHGLIGLKEAIVQSCDVYFYDLALSLGIDRLYYFLHQFGFGEKTGIDLVNEKAGILPSRGWKLKSRGEKWLPGETLITGIGQGFTQTTPLQLANATAILAGRGKNVKPHLVDRIVTGAGVSQIVGEEQPPVDLNESNLDEVIQAMESVVHGVRGTARRIGQGISYKIAGKTGTAQVFTVKEEEKYNEAEIDFKLRDHSLFIAFAPADRPRIAVAVVVENGGHGGLTAAPVAARVIAQYLGDSP